VDQAPILVIAFNQPTRLARLLDSLKKNPPRSLRISIDGPRGPNDIQGVRECQRIAESVDWVEDLDVWPREKNVGIARGIPMALNKAFEEFNEVFVVEDDVTLGRQAHSFVSECLNTFRNSQRVFSISAYNNVPSSSLSNPQEPARLSRVSSSYAWATWKDRWETFDWEMKWFTNQSIKNLSQVLGSKKAAFRWRQHVRFVRKELVHCAAYRWNVSSWEYDGVSVVPNRSLLEYHGITDGTHTRRARKWEELPVEVVEFENLTLEILEKGLDWRAEDFYHQKTQRATAGNILLWPIEEFALRLQRRGII